eukprot:UN06521
MVFANRKGRMIEYAQYTLKLLSIEHIINCIIVAYVFVILLFLNCCFY